jgi:hypothetical protein
MLTASLPPLLIKTWCLWESKRKSRTALVDPLETRDDSRATGNTRSTLPHNSFLIAVRSNPTPSTCWRWQLARIGPTGGRQAKGSLSALLLPPGPTAREHFPQDRCVARSPRRPTNSALRGSQPKWWAHQAALHPRPARSKQILLGLFSRPPTKTAIWTSDPAAVRSYRH